MYLAGNAGGVAWAGLNSEFSRLPRSRSQSRSSTGRVIAEIKPEAWALTPLVRLIDDKRSFLESLTNNRAKAMSLCGADQRRRLVEGRGNVPLSRPAPTSIHGRPKPFPRSSDELSVTVRRSLAKGDGHRREAIAMRQRRALTSTRTHARDRFDSPT